ncbi:MAG: TraB/GumN family protein [Saprospiraceae bacterium]
MTKIFNFILFLFLLTAAPLFAQVALESEVSTEVVTPELEKALLWKISGKELTQPSYLFGTIHMIGKEDFSLSDVTKESFAKTERVTFEIDMADMNDMSKQMSMMMKAFMEGGKTLKQLLSEEDYKLVSDYFNKMGMPMMFLERIKPMFLSALTATDMSPTAMQSGEVVSYEMELMKMAQAKEKETGGLETMEFQMSMFDSIPYEAQAAMLVDGLKNQDSGNEQFAEMVKLYKAQDINAMHKMIDSDESGVGDYEELLLVNRNLNWIPIMEKMMEEKPTFFAVGAGHLGGDKGVVTLLVAAGYDVKPLGAAE